MMENLIKNIMVQDCGGIKMKIIDKTNETWKIGDIVTDNDGRKGTIKKDKDNDFLIVRIDDTHVGDYFNGLVYEAGISNSQLYKQAGNAVTVDVVEQIGKRL